MAVTENSRFAAIENRARKMFGLQFHPEVVHTPRGKEIIANFVHNICGCGKNWTMRNYVEQAVEEIRAQVGRRTVILGLSGGVDSSVAAALIHKAIGDQLTCIFVNNGVLRGREAEVVREVFGRHFKIKLQYEDASKLFLRAAQGRDRSRNANARSSARRSSKCSRPRPSAPARRSSSRKARFTRRDRVRAHRRQSRRA